MIRRRPKVGQAQVGLGGPLLNQPTRAAEVDASLFSIELIQPRTLYFGVGLRGQDFDHGKRVRRVCLVEGRVDPHNRIDMSELGMGLVWRSFHASKFRAAVLKSQLS